MTELLQSTNCIMRTPGSAWMPAGSPGAGCSGPGQPQGVNMSNMLAKSFKEH